MPKRKSPIHLPSTPAGRILVSAKGATVDFSGLKGKADIYVVQDGATLTGVPAGSKVDFSGAVKTATVNGTKVDVAKAEDYTVPTSSTTEPGTGSGTGTGTGTGTVTPGVPAADGSIAVAVNVYVVDGDVEVYYVGNDAKIVNCTYGTSKDAVTFTVSSAYEVVSASFNGTTLTFKENVATVDISKLADGKGTALIVVKKK